MGLTLSEVRTAFIESLGDPFEPSQGVVTISVRTQQILERAIRKAVELQDDEVSSQHVLLALVDEWDALAVAPLLAKHGAEEEVVRERVIASTDRGLAEGARVPEVILQSTASERISRPPEPELAPTPGGHDPRRRLPWGSAVVTDSRGNPMRLGSALRQYLIDRDGNPVLTVDGQPVHLLVDDKGKLILDEQGNPILAAVEVPRSSSIS